MAIILSQTHEKETQTMASAYAEAMLKAMSEHPGVMELEADLARSLLGADAIRKMQENYPGQYVDCGIQEANMMSVAAGLSIMGRVPFIHTFAAFASRRIADQVFISGCYAKANVRIIGSDPGISSQYNGGTHMPFEDISIFKAFPEMTILDVTDSVMMKDIVSQLSETYGMYYIRLFRKNAVQVYQEGSEFTIGKANMLREGNDVTIITAGAVMVPEALQAAEKLEQKGIHARVLDMFTIKPFDTDALEKAICETGAIVTAENHNIINGLGSSAADYIATTHYAPLEMVGIRDRFGEVGPMDYLKKTMCVSSDDIAAAAERAISRKKH